MRRALLAATALSVLLAAGPARAGRDYDPRAVRDSMDRRPKPPNSSWLVSWPLASKDHPEGDEVGRALADVLAFSAFQHFRRGGDRVRIEDEGGEGVLWRARPRSGSRAFEEARDELIEARVDLVIHGRYQVVAGDYLVVPKVTVLPAPGSGAPSVRTWSTKLSGGGREVEFSVGVEARTFDLPRVVVPGEVVEQHVDRDGWRVCRVPVEGAERCPEPAGPLGPAFSVDDFSRRPGGFLMKVRTTGGPRLRGYVFVPLGSEMVEPTALFVAGLSALLRRQPWAPIHFDGVARDPRATSEMRAHSLLYACLAVAGSASRAGRGADGCGDRLDRARAENPYDRAVADYQVMELARRLKVAEERSDPTRTEAMLKVFDLGIQQVGHRLSPQQRAAVEAYSESVGLQRVRQDAGEFLLEKDDRPRREGTRLRPGELRRIERRVDEEAPAEPTAEGSADTVKRLPLYDLRVQGPASFEVETVDSPALTAEGATALPASERIDYAKLMDRILEADAVLKRDAAGRIRPR